MMRKINLNLNYFCILFLLMLGSCIGITEDKIIGEYGITKPLIRDTTSKAKVYPRLIIKNDKTFELKYFDKDNKIKGFWDLISSKNSNEGIVQFTFKNKRVNGIIKGTIFYFRYPNDLYDGKFKSVLYVRQYENGPKWRK